MTMSLRIRTGLLLLIFAACVCPSGFAQSKDEKPKLTPQDEKNALQFARQHHPELAELVKQLQKGNRDEYRSAIVQLHQTHVRLERFRERSPERFALLLSQWKLDSRLRLLVAQMEMADDPALMSQIDKLLAEKIRNRTEILELDRNRTRERLNRILEQIAELNGNAELAKKKELNMIRRSLGLQTDQRSKNEQRTKKPMPKRIQIKAESPNAQGPKNSRKEPK
ncbi:hypothetical protein [Thalassoroseus pseudoceratinae]|uniref:hypothetical protein n=1 Tax=Thalassoroseus pseudoceratinae TaxID=2713176 RepID=UPI001422B013|nr:hypothetical protein [Thalassoroseus pseudoceratinae]